MPKHMRDETSVSDLANILDVTVKIVRERISELQSYHLITTGIKESGDAVVKPPSDLVSIVDLLRIHLGTDAKGVEQACARAQAESSTSIRAVGSGIRQVVGAWNASRPDEALIIAKALKQQYSKNGDVANILGQAFVKVFPARLDEADVEFDAARRLRCGRPELLFDSVRVKLAREDWLGVYQLTRSLRSNSPTLDFALDGFLKSCEGLISIARIRDDDRRIAELSFEAFEKLTAKFNLFRLDKNVFDQLNEQRLNFGRQYVRALDRRFQRAGDKLDVFDGFAQLAESGVVLVDVASTGLNALELWWKDVERRPIVDLTACSILNRKLQRLAQIEKALAPFESTKKALIKKINRLRLDLEHRGGLLSRS